MYHPMLTFVGLGLYDERSVTIRGRDVIAAADYVVVERYTSQLAGANVAQLEGFHGRPIDPVDRDSVEQHPGDILDRAEGGPVAFLVGGDPMISTTHVDLRLRAAERGIDTRIVHGPSAETAAASLTGLQNYRFGKATTIPFPGTIVPDSVPKSVIETISENQDRGLHTLVYLDIDAANDRTLDADYAADLLQGALEDCLGVVVARAGSSDPTIMAHRLSTLATCDFGPSLHLLVIPGDLHELEAEALSTFANAPPELLKAG